MEVLDESTPDFASISEFDVKQLLKIAGPSLDKIGFEQSPYKQHSACLQNAINNSLKKPDPTPPPVAPAAPPKKKPPAKTKPKPILRMDSPVSVQI